LKLVQKSETQIHVALDIAHNTMQIATCWNIL